MAERVALLEDIEPPPYEHAPINVQERAPTTSVTQGDNGSGQPAGYPLQSQLGYPPSHGYPSQGYAQPLYPLQQQQPVPAGALTTQNMMVMHSGCTTVVPAVYPDDNCFFSWFVCLCCFWPLGIVSIIHSNRARDAINRGDYVAAMGHSKDSRRFSYWAIGVHLGMILIIGVLAIIIYFI